MEEFIKKGTGGRDHSGCVQLRGGDEFSIHSDLAEFPVSGYPEYMKESVGGVCVSGSATMVVFNSRFRLHPGTVIIILPWQLASIRDVTDDFRVTFFRVSREMFTDSLSTMWRLTPGFFFYMSKHIASAPDNGNITRMLNFCDLLAYRTVFFPERCRRESIMQLLRVFYWDCYTVYINDPAMQDEKNNYTRKEELAFRFMRMIVEEHSIENDVAYYAGKLGITPKYLTNLVRSISGCSARDWIVYFIILEIKSLLRESTMDLKAISVRANFPDQSTFSRFFRHYTGMSPSQYRKEIHF